MNTHATRATTYVTRAMRCLPIAALCLAGQAMAQAAPASDGGVQAPTERAKPAHGEVRPVPATPPNYPSKPQPPVPTRR